MSVSQVIKAIFPTDRKMKSDEWYTPEDIMRRVRRVLGHIDLDPCSCLEANKIVKARNFYTIKNDGLSKDWYGSVWMNPPRGMDKKVSIQSLWCEKLVGHYQRNEIHDSIFIVRAVIGYDWFERIWGMCPDVCFLSTRPKYYRGVVGHTAGQDQITSAIFYLGGDTKKFQSVFRGMGRIFDKDSYR